MQIFNAGDEVEHSVLGVGQVIRVTLLAAGATAVVIYFAQSGRTIEFGKTGLYLLDTLTKMVAPISTTVGAPLQTAPLSSGGWSTVYQAIHARAGLSGPNQDLIYSVGRRLEQLVQAHPNLPALESMAPKDILRLLVKTMDSAEDIDVVMYFLPREKRVPGVQSTLQFGQSRVNQTIYKHARINVRQNVNDGFLQEVHASGRYLIDETPPEHSPHLAADTAARKGSVTPAPTRVEPPAKVMTMEKLPIASRDSWESLISRAEASAAGRGASSLSGAVLKLRAALPHLPRLEHIRTAQEFETILAMVLGEADIAGVRAERMIRDILQLAPIEFRRTVAWSQMSREVPHTFKPTGGEFNVQDNAMTQWELLRQRAHEVIPEGHPLWDAPGVRANMRAFRTRAANKSTTIVSYDDAAIALAEQQLAERIIPGHTIPTQKIAIKLREKSASTIELPTVLHEQGKYARRSAPIMHAHLPEDNGVLSSGMIDPIEEELAKGMASQHLSALVDENITSGKHMKDLISQLDPFDPHYIANYAYLEMRQRVHFRTASTLAAWRRLHHDAQAAERDQWEVQAEDDDFIAEHNLTDQVKAGEAAQRKLMDEYRLERDPAQEVIRDYLEAATRGKPKNLPYTEFDPYVKHALALLQKKSDYNADAEVLALQQLAATAKAENRGWHQRMLNLTTRVSTHEELAQLVGTALRAGARTSAHTWLSPVDVLPITEISFGQGGALNAARPPINSAEQARVVAQVRESITTKLLPNLHAYLGMAKDLRTTVLTPHLNVQGEAEQGALAVMVGLSKRAGKSHQASVHKLLSEVQNASTPQELDAVLRRAQRYVDDAGHFETAYRQVTGTSLPDVIGIVLGKSRGRETLSGVPVKLSQIITDANELLGRLNPSSTQLEDLEYTLSRARDARDLLASRQLAAAASMPVALSSGESIPMASLINAVYADAPGATTIQPGRTHMQNGQLVVDALRRNERSVVGTLAAEFDKTIGNPETSTFTETHALFTQQLVDVAASIHFDEGRRQYRVGERPATVENIITEAIRRTREGAGSIASRAGDSWYGLHQASLDVLQRQQLYIEQFGKTYGQTGPAFGLTGEQTRAAVGYLGGYGRSLDEGEFVSLLYGSNAITTSTAWHTLYDNVTLYHGVIGHLGGATPEILERLQALMGSKMSAADRTALTPVADALLRDPGVMASVSDLSRDMGAEGLQLDEVSAEDGDDLVIDSQLPTPDELREGQIRPMSAPTQTATRISDPALILEFGRLGGFAPGNGATMLYGGKHLPIIGFREEGGQPILELNDSGKTITATPGGRALLTPDLAEKVVTRDTNTALEGRSGIWSDPTQYKIERHGGRLRLVGPDGLPKDRAEMSRLQEGKTVLGVDIETFGAAQTPYSLEMGRGIVQADGSLGTREEIRSRTDVVPIRIDEATAANMRATLSAGPRGGSKRYELLTQGLGGIMDATGAASPLAAIDLLTSEAALPYHEAVDLLTREVENASAVAGFNIRHFDLPILGVTPNVPVIDLLDAATAANGGHMMRLQDLLPFAETHGGSDVADALTAGWDYARTHEPMKTGAVGEANYFVHNRTGDIYQAGDVRELVYDRGPSQFGTRMTQVIGEKEADYTPRTMDVVSETVPRLEASLQNQFLSAKTLEAAQELQAWKISDLSARRLRRHEVRYLAQDRLIATRVQEVMAQGGDIRDGLRSFYQELGQFPDKLDQLQQLGAQQGLTEEQAYAASHQLQQGLSTIGLSGSREQIIRRAERTQEAVGRILAGTEGTDSNVLLKQFQSITSGPLTENSEVWNAFGEFSTKLDDAIGDGKISAMGGNAIMSELWETMLSKGWAKKIVKKAGSRNAFEMRDAVSLGEMSVEHTSGARTAKAGSLSLDLSTDTNVQRSLEMHVTKVRREMSDEAEGIYPDRSLVEDAVHTAVRDALGIDQSITGADLVKAVRKKRLDEDLEYIDTASLGKGEAKAPVLQLLQKTTAALDDPVSLVRTAHNEAVTRLEKEGPLSRVVDAPKVTDVEYYGDPTTIMIPTTPDVETPNLRPLPELGPGTQILQDSAEERLMGLFNRVSQHQPSGVLGEYGGHIAGVLGMIALGAVGMMAPRLGGQRSHDEAPEEQSLAPLTREVLEPPQPMHIGGNDPRHLEITIRGTNSGGHQSQMLHNMIQHTLQAHTGVDYSANADERDRRRPMGQLWIRDLERGVY